MHRAYSTFVATALPDPAALALFTELRTRHFPPARNIVPAHISLFHQLPGDELGRVTEWLTTRLADQPPLPARTSGVRFLGSGVALLIDCPPLRELRAAMAAEWWDVLTPQDRQPFHPHVTIQNKAEPAAARALYEEMLAGFELPWILPLPVFGCGGIWVGLGPRRGRYGAG